MVWAIGDIQGCYKPLMELLKKIEFDPAHDRLWLAGDLVNRGEGSLETLEYLYSVRESLEIVLGNHDIALFAAYLGFKKSNPTIDPVLQSPKAEIYIDWLRHKEFLHIDSDLGYCMSHAGISPEFDLYMAKDAAREIEKELQSDKYEKWLSSMFGKGKDHYDSRSSEIEKQRYILSSFIRMRFCYEDGRLEFKQKGAPGSDPVKEHGLIPWFSCPSRKEIDSRIIFGHWSTLGYYSDENVCCLDTGCVWNGTLTAIRIDDGSEKLVQVKCER